MPGTIPLVYHSWLHSTTKQLTIIPSSVEQRAEESTYWSVTKIMQLKDLAHFLPEYQHDFVK
jgi:hypothetical protein